MRDLNFALEEVRLWRHIERMAVALSPLEAKKDDSEDQIEKIYTWEKKICKFQDNACKAIAKIQKICTDTV